jgi:cytochrome c peroxidase
VTERTVILGNSARPRRSILAAKVDSQRADTPSTLGQGEPANTHPPSDMRNSHVLLASLMLALPLLAAGDASLDGWRRPDTAPAPEDNLLTPARAELGRALFFDPRLSAKGVMSCASCHNPALGWSDGRPTAVGHDMKMLGRATPTITNAGFNPLQMWDGRKLSLEEQALGPFESPDEQNLPLGELEARVRSIRGYQPLFERAYAGQGITRMTIAKAIASFERTILSDSSDFDRWIAGQADAMDAAAQRGFDVFKGKGDCVLCHQGFNFTDNGFHNIGLKDSGALTDPGRYAYKKVPALKGAFKTPTLRDIARTAPYMHHGVYATLEEVVEHYVRGGDARANLSPNIRPLHLSGQEKRDLIAFMHALTSSPRAVSIPQLPQ